MARVEKEVKTKGVYYDCHDCKRRWKVKHCPICSKKLKGAYSQPIATITGCSLQLDFGDKDDILNWEDGDI